MFKHRIGKTGESVNQSALIYELMSVTLRVGYLLPAAGLKGNKHSEHMHTELSRAHTDSHQSCSFIKLIKGEVIGQFDVCREVCVPLPPDAAAIS